MVTETWEAYRVRIYDKLTVLQRAQLESLETYRKAHFEEHYPIAQFSDGQGDCDSGGPYFALFWKWEAHHMEVELFKDGRLGWYYRNMTTGTSIYEEGCLFPELMPEALLSVLSLLTVKDSL
jgi:hypothetical protein